MNRLFIAAAMAAFIGGSNWSLAQDLVIGSKAPKLEVQKFIKGEPVKTFEKGKTYVVDLWGTWCPPCREAIPHLSKLQQKHKDVTFIGVAVLQQDPEEVVEFVDEAGDKMDYRVALDLVPEDAEVTEGAMFKNWMEPAEKKLPLIFIINGDGLIAWIGRPAELEPTLAKVVAGEWDVPLEARKAKALAAEQKKLAEYNTKFRKLFADLENDNDPTKILNEVEVATKDLPSHAVQFAMYKFQVLATVKGTEDKAVAAGEELVEMPDVVDNPDSLTTIAWFLVSPDREKPADPRLIKLALKISIKADNLAQQKDPMIADTLAKAYFDNGLLEKAVETQERVIDLVPGTSLENDPTLKRRLRQYRKALEASKAEDAPKK